MRPFHEVFPDPNTLLQLEPEDVGPLILEYLNGLPSTQQLHRYNFVSGGFGGELPSYAEGKLPDIRKVLSEGWNWLEPEGLLIPSPNDSTGAAYVISRRGQQLRTWTDFEAFKRASLLGQRTLDPVLAQK